MKPIKRKKSTGKVKNATPTEYLGIQFKSRLEMYCYKQLVDNKIKAKYEDVTYILMPGFKFLNKSFRPITYTPDFIGKDFIIECKGYKTEVFKIKWKLFLYYLINNPKLRYDLYMPRNQREVNEVITEILNK